VRHVVAPGPRGIAAADLNGDGISDLVTASFDSELLSVLRGNGGGGFADAVEVPAGKQPYAVEVADMDVDGTPDLVTVNRSTAEVSVLLATPGVFQYQLASSWGVALNPVSVAVGDLNGDDVPDIVAAASMGSALSVILSAP
jgi:hypothetical protein